MIKFFSLDESAMWDKLVSSLPNYDVYYLSGYVKAFRSHGDGDPALIWWENGDLKGACVIMIRDIAEDRCFSKLPHELYFDAVTPYGYGGFIFSRPLSEEQESVLLKEFTESLRQRNIISVFFRFHPILQNSDYSKQLCEVVDLGKTISVDLKDRDTIWNNFTSKNRNVIRKAEKSGVKIHHGRSFELLIRFKEIYEETMREDNAEEYYFFDDNFYKSIAEDLKDNYEIFYAVAEEKIISMAIIIFANGCLHYHFSGSLRAYRSLAPSNLLLYRVALWGNEQGYRLLHLGGGVGSGEDALYKFKAAFNRNSNNQFSIGKLIVDPNIYSELVSLRKQEPTFNSDSQFFPLYRS